MKQVSTNYTFEKSDTFTFFLSILYIINYEFLCLIRFEYSRKLDTSILFNRNMNVIHYELNILGTELFKMYIYIYRLFCDV